MFKKLLLVLGLLLFLTSCGGETAFQKEYPELKDNKHLFEVVDADGVLKLINDKESAIIVLGFKECPWCQKLIPFVNEIAKEKNHKKVYYVDIKDMRDNLDSSDHPKYLQIKEAFKEAVDESKDRINAPTTVVLKDGVLVGYHLDTVDSHVMNDNKILPSLNAEQAEELREILRNLFK